MAAFPTSMALMRGLHLAATLSLLGTLSFIAWILPASTTIPDALRRGLIRLWWVSGLLALLAGVAWFSMQSAAIAGASGLSEVWAALPVVAAHTRYGNMLMVRLGLLLVATLLGLARAYRRGADRVADFGPGESLGVYAALILVAATMGTQGMIGHAGATAGTAGDELVLSEALHVLAAGVWLGGLLPLWLSLRTLPSSEAAAVCLRFSPIGLACVLVLAGTGFAQGLELIGSIPALFGTPYGHIALLKIVLFLLALVLAAVNRLWLTDRLAAGAAGARRHLSMSASVEAVAGLAIVMAAAFLASRVPGAHQEPVWPFSWQFSLVTVQEDAAFRQEVLVSLILIGAAILLMAAALVWRRFRMVALVVLLAMIAWRGPSFSLLTTEAYPTSFQFSPTGFAAASIVYGKTLFMQNCAACHGPEGKGNGQAAAALRIKPADLTMPHLWEHSDGEMFWWLTHGIDDPEGGLAMPGFGGILSANDRWALIDYVRAHNAGVAMQQDATFDTPLRPPAVPLACNGVTATNMSDLRGKAVHVILGDVAKDRQPMPPQDGFSIVTLVIPPPASSDEKPAPGSCIAIAPAAWSAYAVLADLQPDEAAGAEFLIDPNGWLRAARRPGEADGWHTRGDLLAAVRDICFHPITKPSGGSHEHHH